MKILITGGSGLLGQYLNVFLSRRNNILTLHNKNVGNCGHYKTEKLDLLDNKSLEKLFNLFNPDIVFHTAAISNTILPKEISKKYVYELNVNVTKNIAQLCHKYRSKLVYISTDLVYAGYRGSMLKENAKLNPVSLYAETKLMGEIKIQETFNNYIILRMALLFGFGLWHSKNHFQKMFKDLKYGKEVKLFTDQFRTPISIIESANIITEILNKNIESEIINLGGRERISRYELGDMLCEMTNYDKGLLVKIKMDEVKNLPEVEDVSMDTTKLQSYDIKQRSIEQMMFEILYE